MTNSPASVLSPAPAPAPLDTRAQTQAVLAGLLDKLTPVALIVGGIALALSMLRMSSGRGFGPNVTLDLVAYVAVMTLLVLRKRMPITLVGSLFLGTLGVYAVVNLGMMGLGSASLLALSTVCILAAMFFGRRIALGVLGATLVACSGVAVLMCSGVLKTLTQPDVYLLQPTTWMSHISSCALYALVVIFTLHAIQQRLMRSTEEVSRQAREIFEREQKFRLLAEHMTDILFVQDMQFNVTYLSPSVRTVLGCDPAQVYQGGLEKFMTAESLQRAKASFADAYSRLSQGPVHIPLMEYEYIREDGSTFWGELRVGFLFDDAGKPIGSQGILRDISERKRAQIEREDLQQRLRQSEKLEAIGQLAGGVAHDFNNHLAAMFGAADCIRLASCDGTETMELANTILAAGRRAADLTRKLLTFARKGSQQRTAVDVPSLLSEVTTILHRSIDPRTEIRLRIESTDAVVMADASQLESALLNLGINARDAMPEGGELEFKVRDCTLTSEEAMRGGVVLTPGRYVEIIVSDTGTGIPIHVQERLFEPFFTTKDPSKGTGLGLAAVFGTVTSLGGGISVTSIEGRGTRFRLLLPFAQLKPEEKSGPAPSAPTSASLNVLVVEDDPVVRLVASKVLKVLGHRVTACVDGVQALGLFHEAPDLFDVVLMDILMPGMSGTDVFTKMRELSPTVRVILASGQSATNEVNAALSHGAKAFVSKPYSIETIREALAKAMG